MLSANRCLIDSIWTEFAGGISKDFESLENYSGKVTKDSVTPSNVSSSECIYVKMWPRYMIRIHAPILKNF